MLGWLLYLLYDLYLALFVLGEDCCVVGTDELLAVEFLESLEVGLGVLNALVFACVEEHLVVAHIRSLLYLRFSSVHWLLSSNT